VCGTKNFVSVRLYSAPQSHWTIVAIFGICAFGEPVQAGSFAAIKSDPLPGLGRSTSNGKLLASCGMHIGLLMRPTYVDGNDVDVNRFKRDSKEKCQRSPAMSACWMPAQPVDAAVDFVTKCQKIDWLV
jgi:hypothetical protein